MRTAQDLGSPLSPHLSVGLLGPALAPGACSIPSPSLAPGVLQEPTWSPLKLSSDKPGPWRGHTGESRTGSAAGPSLCLPPGIGVSRVPIG